MTSCDPEKLIIDGGASGMMDIVLGEKSVDFCMCCCHFYSLPTKVGPASTARKPGCCDCLSKTAPLAVPAPNKDSHE